MKKSILTSIIVCSCLLVFGQQDFIMYNLRDVPQSIYSNPSNRFDGKFYIGLPGLSSNYFSLSNTGFAYSDAVVKRGNELFLDFDNLLNELEDDNYLALNARIDILSFGITLSERTQLSVHFTENINLRLNYSKEFMEFVYRGNGAFSSSTVSFDGLGLNMNHYREYGIGVSHQLNEKLRLGLKAKYLYGMENIYNEESDIRITTNQNNFALTGSADISLKTAGIDGVDDDEETMDYLTGRANTGFAFDVGGNYELNDQWSFNASVIDFGFIKWKDYVTNYSNNGSPFTYNGVDINVFGDDDPNGETSFDRVLDSLEEAMNLDTTHGSYTAPLTSRVYMGANYKINERSTAGGIIQTEIFQGNIRPSFTLNYNRKMTKWITLSAAYTMINRSFDNLGLGVVLDPGPVQFYLVTDNALGALLPQHARHAQFRFGINLIFGRNKTVEFHKPFQGVIGSSDEGKGSDSETESTNSNEGEESE